MGESQKPSEVWLRRHGLIAKKLDLNYILKQLGFGHVEKFEGQIRKTVCAKYGQKLFQKYANRDGKVYNVIGSEDRLREYSEKLLEVRENLKSRLQRITSGSYRVFGIVSAKKPLILVHIETKDHQRRELFFNELRKLVTEQLQGVTSFCLMSSARDLEEIVLKCDDENQSSKHLEALSWLDNVQDSPSEDFDCSSVLEKAIENIADFDSLYIFAENNSLENDLPKITRLLEEKKAKLNVVSYNNPSHESLKELETLVSNYGGTFRAFSINETEEDSISKTTAFFGGRPEGVSLDEDAFLIWTELEECKQTIEDVENIYERLKSMREMYEQEAALKAKKTIESETKRRKPPNVVTNDNYLSSEQWLNKYGIEACKLDFYSFLAGHVFKHCNGVVDIKTEPSEEDLDFKAPADEKSVLVNAKYCKKFVHIVWKDGEIRHVLLTGSVYRGFIERANLLSDKIKQRMNFLKAGSRELFGTICENNIYLLIDTSSSMEGKIDLVIRKLHQLMDEQIRDKSWFNIVCFNSQIVPWRSHMVEVSPANLKAAKTWTKVMSTDGSTNTLEALQFALSDKKTQGVYLLTDGRPDQPEKAIFNLIQIHTPVPIHTISFNCFDKAANDFLHHIASETGGRFHLYQDHAYNPDKDGPRPHVSLDLVLLQKEFESLKQTQKVIKTLRQECELMEKFVEPEPDEKSSGLKSASSSSIEQSVATRRKIAQEKKKYKAKKSMSCLSNASSESDVRRQSLRKTIKGESDEWMLDENREVFMDEKKMTEAVKKQIRKNEFRKKVNETAEMQDAQTTLIEDSEVETPNVDSIDQWMKKHSLIAKKLTLIDALRPTIVRHSAKYIPILDKHVTGKVFEEIFPDFYVNGANKEEIKFVNPSGVDLEKYEQRVEKQIRIYKHKLNKLIWDALPSEERLRHFDDKGPVSFFNNKEKMAALLDELDWPVNKDDFDLLLDEINLGYELIQKSKDLRNANLDFEGDEQNVEAVEQLVESSARSRSAYESGRNRKTRKPRSESGDDGHPNIIDISPIGRRGYSNIEGVTHGEIVRKHPVQSKLAPNTQSCLLPESKGLPVIARNEIDGYYYPATVVESDSSNSAIVRFSNNTPSSVETRHIIPRAGAISGPMLQVGDFVLVQKPKDVLQKFHPGIILALPVRSEPQPHFYTVILWNRQQVSSVRKLIVKVSQQRFQETATYIHDMNKISLELQDNTADFGQSMKISKLGGSGKSKSLLSREKEKKVKPIVSPYSTNSASKPSKSNSSSSKTPLKSSASKTSVKSDEKNKNNSLRPSDSKISSKKSSVNSALNRSASGTIQTENSSSTTSKSESRTSSKSGSFSDSKSRSDRSPKSRSPASQSNASSTPERSLENRSPTRLDGRAVEDEESDGKQDDTEQQVSEIKNEPEVVEEDKAEDLNETLQEVGDSEEPELAGMNQTSTIDQFDDRPKSPTPQDSRFGVTTETEEPPDFPKKQKLYLEEFGDSVKDKFLALKTEEQRAEYLQKILETAIEQNLSMSEKNQNRVQQQMRAADNLDLSIDDERDEYIVNVTGTPIRASKLERNEQILAKWPVDQWFYKQRVIKDMSKGYYAVQDEFGNMEILSRLEMISEENDADDVIKKDDYVLALYPFFDDERFGPGRVTQGNISSTLVVEFFDSRVANVTLENCYKISFQKFANEMAALSAMFQNWVTSPIVFKCDSKKQIQAGLIWDFDPHLKYKMVVKDAKSELSFQKVENLYGPIRKAMSLSRGEHVLAPCSDSSADYVPGMVIADEHETVTVKAGAATYEGVLKNRCVWISRRQYNELLRFARENRLLPVQNSPSPNSGVRVRTFEGKSAQGDSNKKITPYEQRDYYFKEHSISDESDIFN